MKIFVIEKKKRFRYVLVLIDNFFNLQTFIVIFRRVQNLRKSPTLWFHSP